MTRDKSQLLKLMGIGRFQVMALLQAARYYLLHGDMEKAKSWGLNRAIFYAWAKRYGPRGVAAYRLRRRAGGGGGRCPEGFVNVLGECVEVSPRGWFMIGGEEQTPQDFERNVVRRVSRILPWEKVWKAALDYVGKFPRWVLENPNYFFKYVYEPVRDTFFVELLEGRTPEPPRTLIERFRSLDELVRRGSRGQSLQGFLGGGSGGDDKR